MEYFLLGLGNPPDYQGTRHNIGKDIVEGLVAQSGAQWRNIGKNRVACTMLGPHIISCAVSDGYMNEVGEDMQDLLREIDPSRLLVIHDDIDFAPGTVRLSRGKNAGGHRGIASLVDTLGTNDFPRLRIGVGKGGETKEHVLGKIRDDEMRAIESGLKKSLPTIFQRLFG